MRAANVAEHAAAHQHGSEPRSRRSRAGRLILAAGATAALIAAPVTLGAYPLGLAWQLAAAKSDGGGGHGNGGHGNGHEANSNRGLGRSDDHGGGWGHGRDRQDDRIERARERYEVALGRADAANRGPKADEQRVAHHFSADETHELLEHGWRTRAVSDAGFRNHGERVRTMVELARRLGYDPRAGALQANFGTPYENGIAQLEAELATARADAAAGDDRAAARVDELEAQLEAAVAAAKPGSGANHDWARADLDVNGDGAVDRGDLAALDSAPDEEAPPS